VFSLFIFSFSSFLFILLFSIKDSELMNHHHHHIKARKTPG